MKELVIYLHGKGGSAAEAEHYRPLFPESEVLGLDYASQTPWEAKEELPRLLAESRRGHDRVRLIANSIGAYFALHALGDAGIDQAMLISPVVDMERLIRDMLGWVGITEEELRRRGEIPTDFGETLSWDYLCYVRAHPIRWRIPTHILCGEHDTLAARETVETFAAESGAALTVMPGGEHWFHTPEQMAFLDDWIRRCR